METKKKNRRWVIIVFGLLFLLLPAVGATYVTGRIPFLPGTRTVSDHGATLFVDILSPAMSANFTVGQPVQVHAQVWGLAPVDTVQLIADGQVVSDHTDNAIAKPFDVSLVWEGSSPGAHTLSVKATDLQGQTQQSQTLIINLNSPPFRETVAASGDTLVSISQANGVPVNEVVALNPGLSAQDPNTPVNPGYQVRLPSRASRPAQNTEPLQNQPTGSVQAQTGLSMLIQWALNFSQPVDESYCYQTTDAVNWQRNPARAFNFLPGQQWQQPILLNAQRSNVILVMDCWGWKAGILNYLGQGQTILSIGNVPREITLQASGFQAVGVPLINPQASILQPGEVPPPYGLREPQSASECVKYFGSPLAKLACDEWVNEPVQSHDLLIWDWQPGTCLPGVNNCNWINEIRGYQVFALDTNGKPKELLQSVEVGQQLAAIPVSWGPVCYGVRAYSGHPLGSNPLRFSKMVVHCPSDPAQPQKVTIDMDEWYSAEGWTLFDPDCPYAGKKDSGVSYYGNTSKDGYPPLKLYPKGTQVLVGDQWTHASSGCDEHRNAKALIHFPLNKIPAKAVIQRATLQFVQEGNIQSYDGGAASGKRPICATRLFTSQQTWQPPSGKHFINYGDPSPPGTDYGYWSDQFTYAVKGAPYQSMTSTTTQYDVTADVLHWYQNPASNYGFSLQSSTVDLQYTGLIQPNAHKSGYSACWSTLNNIQLVVEYFAP